MLRESYRREYDALLWNDDASGFEAWCEGRTGYPIVDAGMRQLRATGWMHNRMRMIVASFLTDAQPCCRIFNPLAQGRRWDPDGRYLRRWIPELRDVPDANPHAPWEAGPFANDYPPPVVDHAERREEALERYREARERAQR